MKKRYKKIQGGRLVREALWTPVYPADTPRQRAEKTKLTSAARQKLNDRASWQKLKMVLAANFDGADLVLTLTYDDAHLPPDRDSARQQLKKFLAQVRSYRRTHGVPLRYIYITEDKHTAGRLHHHLVINGTGADLDIFRSLWQGGRDIEIDTIDVYGYEELARYLTKEPRDGGRARTGERMWTPSLGLAKPQEQPTEWVPAGFTLDPPLNSHILRREKIENEWGSYEYIEYLLPYAPKAKKTRPRVAAARKDFLSFRT